MKYTILGILWRDEYNEQLYYEKTIPNPEYRPEHWNCDHILEPDERERRRVRGEHCAECGRKIKMVKHKQQITTKTPYSWVTRYDAIETLILTNPWTTDEYMIMIDKATDKKWLVALFIPHDTYELIQIEPENVLAFKSFAIKFFGTDEIILTNILN